MSDEKEKISPVFGLILMVIITMILAAVIGFFALQTGDQIEQDARASVDVEEFDGNVMVDVQTLDNSDFIFIAGFDEGDFNTSKNAFYIDYKDTYILETNNASDVAFYIKAVIGEEEEVFRDDSIESGNFVNLKEVPYDSVTINKIKNVDLSD